MDEFEYLFYEAESEYVSDDKDIVERVIDDAKEEFTGYSKEHQSRQEEIKQLTDNIKQLQKDINKCKNIKNTKPVYRKMNEKLSIKRRRLRNEIDKCKLRLKEIDEEVRPLTSKDEREKQSFLSEEQSLSSITKTPFL